MKLKPVIWGVVVWVAGAASCELPLRADVLARKPPMRVVHWDTEEGLPPSHVVFVLQTRDGYLWFASQEGLTRFDGIECRIFNSRNTPAFTGNSIRTLHEDGRGVLWIGMEGGGLMRYLDGEFRRFGRREGLRNEVVSAVQEGPKGRLWVGTDGGGLFRKAGERFEKVEIEDELSDRSVVGMAVDSEGGLVVAYRDGIRHLRGDEVRGHRAREESGLKDVAVLACDQKGITWIGSQSGLLGYRDGDFSRPVHRFDSMRNVQAILPLPDGTLWVGTPFRLVLVRGEEQLFYTEKDGLNGSVVHSICRDHEGSIWVGSNASGVDQLKPVRFGSVTPAHGLSHEVATTIFQDRKHRVWIGTEQGLNLIEPDGSMRRFRKEDGLSENMIFTVAEDREGGIWVGTIRGLNHWDGGEFRTYTSQEGLPSSIIWCSYRDRNGRLWIGTRKGLAAVGAEGFEVYDHDGNNLSHDDVRSICEDREGRLWVGTSYGLNRLEGDRFVQHRSIGEETPFKQVLALHADAAGDLWIGTMDKGLIRHRDGRFFQFTPEQGLYDLLVYQILEDDRGSLWLTCNRGVYRVAKAQLEAVAEGRAETFESTVFDRSDGLPSMICNGTIQPAGWKDRQGRLWLPTLKGVAIVEPERSLQNPHPPPVHIETLLADGSPRPLRKQVRIEPGVDRIEIRFNGLSYREPRKVQFKYRLEGFDREWVTTWQMRSAIYTHLPPGHYRFRVKACNNDGVWNEAGAALAMSVVPSWWQTGWFMFLGFLAFTGTLAGTVRYVSLYNYRRRMQELERKHELERERARIARDMHDGLGASLVKISLMGELAESQLGDQGQTRKHLRRISGSARDVVRSLDEIVWAVNPSNDSLENLAHYVCHFAAEHFEASPVECHFDLPLRFPEVELSAEWRHNLFLLVKEALNNVLKHAQAQDVWIRMAVEGDRLELTIEDNGAGLPPEPQRAFGNGLDNMQQRMQSLGGRLNMAARAGGGTKVALAVPLPSR